MVYEEGGQVYLRFIDFGLVVPAGSKGNLGGTPMFLPPEMWPIVPHNPTYLSSFDVYSVGETLYWLMCGGKTFHEHIFDRYAPRGEREIKRGLESEKPAKFCSLISQNLAGLLSLVADYMLTPNPTSRASPKQLLSQGMFKGVDTLRPSQVPQMKDEKAQQPVKQMPKAPQVPKMVPVKKKSDEPTFMDQCNDNKAFWFANVKKCCLEMRYDPRRQQVCNRPCGPKVPYVNGQCHQECQVTSSGQFAFSKKLRCCVAVVAANKCIYSDDLSFAKGDGWRWMAAEGL